MIKAVLQQASPVDIALFVMANLVNLPIAAAVVWNLPDPRGMPVEAVRALRDEIERRVINLASRLGGGNP